MTRHIQVQSFGGPLSLEVQIDVEPKAKPSSCSAGSPGSIGVIAVLRDGIDIIDDLSDSERDLVQEQAEIVAASNAEEAALCSSDV